MTRPEEITQLTIEARTAHANLLAFYKSINERERVSQEEALEFLRLYEEQTITFYRALILSGSFQEHYNLRNAEDFADKHHATQTWPAWQSLHDLTGQFIHIRAVNSLMGDSLGAHFAHDVNNLQLLSLWHDFINDIFLRDIKNDDLNEIEDNPDKIKADTDFIRKIFIEITNNPEAFIRFMAFPMEAARAAFQYENGLPMDCEDLDLEKISSTIGVLMKLRFWEGGLNPIEFELQLGAKAKLRANWGMINSILFNLYKNGGKALKKAREKDQKSENPKITTKITRHSELGITMIFVADNGGGVDPQVVLEQASKMLDEGLGEKIKEAAPAAYNALVKWRSNPFSLNSIKWGEILKLIFTERLSGFELKDVKSSGLGLHGIEYFVRSLGGQIMAANIEGGGMLFGILLPEDASTGGNEIRDLTGSRVLKILSQGWREKLAA